MSWIEKYLKDFEKKASEKHIKNTYKMLWCGTGNFNPYPNDHTRLYKQGLKKKALKVQVKEIIKLAGNKRPMLKIGRGIWQQIGITDKRIHNDKSYQEIDKYINGNS